MANQISFGRRSITIVPDGSTDINLTTVQANGFQMGTQTGDFTVGETVNQATSLASGVVKKWNPISKVLTLWSVTGVFDITHTVTGASSTAHGIPTYIGAAFPNGIRLSDVRFKPSQASDKLVIRGKASATGPILFSLNAASGADEKRSVGGRSMREKLFIAAADMAIDVPASSLLVLEYD